MTESANVTDEDLEAARLNGWVDELDPAAVDAVLEWLSDRGYLTPGGEGVKKSYWEIYISDDAGSDSDP